MAKDAEIPSGDTCKVLFKVINNFGGTEYFLEYASSIAGVRPEHYHLTIGQKGSIYAKEDGDNVLINRDVRASAYAMKGLFGWKKIYLPDATRA